MPVRTQLQVLGPQLRVLIAFVEAAAQSSCDLPDAWDHPFVKSAILTELHGQGWRQSDHERVLERRGWKSTTDIYDAAGIPPNHRRVLDLDSRGWEDKDIARDVNLPLYLIQKWLERDRKKLRMLDLGEFDVS